MELGIRFASKGQGPLWSPQRLPRSSGEQQPYHSSALHLLNPWGARRKFCSSLMGGKPGMGRSAAICRSRGVTQGELDDRGLQWAWGRRWRRLSGGLGEVSHRMLTVVCERVAHGDTALPPCTSMPGRPFSGRPWEDQGWRMEPFGQARESPHAKQQAKWEEVYWSLSALWALPR